MTIFECLDEIITKKNNNGLKYDENLDTISCYMLQRYLSMYSPSFAEILNISSNRMWKSMEDKKMWYKLFSSIIPKSPNKRIAYIKKIDKKQKKKSNSDAISILAEQLEISKREAKCYIEQGYIDIKEIEKKFNI